MADRRFADNPSRVAHRPALYEALGAAFQQRDTATWLELLGQADILCAPIARYAEVTASEQYRHSLIETALQHPVAGRFRLPGFGLSGRDDLQVETLPPPWSASTPPRYWRPMACRRRASRRCWPAAPSAPDRLRPDYVRLNLNT